MHCSLAGKAGFLNHDLLQSCPPARQDRPTRVVHEHHCDVVRESKGRL